LDREHLAEVVSLRGLNRVLYVSDINLYYMYIRFGALSQWSSFRTEVTWWCLEVLVTARARAF